MKEKTTAKLKVNLHLGVFLIVIEGQKEGCRWHLYLLYFTFCKLCQAVQVQAKIRNCTNYYIHFIRFRK